MAALEFIDDEARKRVKRQRVAQEDVQCCLSSPRATYPRHKNTVYRADLSDGRGIKVETRGGKIVNAFYHQ